MKADKTVINTIEKNNLICEGDVLVLGLSGGPDSLSLLHILYNLKSKYHFALFALHFNHMIRGEEADSDEAFLISFCENLGVELKVVKEDIPSLAKKEGCSLEEMGRKRRAEALFSYCEELADRYNGHPELFDLKEDPKLIKNASEYEIYPRVVLAHNADDQAETVLLRIIRGTGVHGLGAMSYFREDGLIRPLLDTPRKDIEDYCLENNLNPRIDSTNLKTDYLRNKLRLELIPNLMKINPGIKTSLQRLARSARMDDEYIESSAHSWLYEHENEKGLLIRDLRGIEKALFNRIVKIKFSEIGLTEDIAAVHIDSLEKCIYQNVGNKKIEFPHGYYAYINYGIVEFRSPN